MFKARLLSQQELNAAALNIRHQTVPLVFALSALAFAFVVLGIFVYQSQRSSVVPYVVTIDRQGTVLAREELKAEQSVPERALAAELCSFLDSLRRHAEAKEEAKQDIRRAYAHVQPGSSALAALNEYYESGEGLEGPGRFVHIENVLRISAERFQIDWTEIYHGSRRKPRKMRAQLTYSLARYRSYDHEHILLNPLGVLVSELHISPIAWAGESEQAEES